jgi:hypothetical protein
LLAADRAFLAAHPPPLDREVPPLCVQLYQHERRFTAYLARHQARLERLFTERAAAAVSAVAPAAAVIEDGRV